jgi:hypothetical protein
MSDAADIVVEGTSLPPIFTARPEARKRLRDFFSSHIRHRNTRRAYTEAVCQFSTFCAELGVADHLTQVDTRLGVERDHRGTD